MPIGGQDFSWIEFIERFLINHEEFMFTFRGRDISISCVSATSTALSFGNQDIGFLWKDYNSPQEFLNDPVFDGKTLEKIWNELD